MSIQNFLVELKKSKWVDLSHEFGPNSPHFPKFNAASAKTIFTNEKDGFLVKEFSFVGQYATHIDPPIHFGAKSGEWVTDIPLKDLIAPLVVIDKSDVVKKNPDYSLTVADIKEWENKNGLIPEGAFVAFRTDWSKRWPNQKLIDNLDSDGQKHYPGWSAEAIEYIYETRHAIANGHETYDTDTAVNQPTKGFIAEELVLRSGHYQVEMLTHLDEVPATGAIISVMTPKFEKAPGFPTRVIAYLP